MRFPRLFRAAHLTTVLSLIAFVLGLGSVAQAAPPMFNGNIITATTPQIDTRWYDPLMCIGGSHYDDAGSQAAIAAAQQLSANKEAVNVLYPGGTCQFTQTVTQQGYSNIQLVGQGSDREQDYGSVCTMGTKFYWAGSTSAPLVLISANSGSTAQNITNAGIQDICFDSNTTHEATNAVVVKTDSDFRVSDVFALPDFSQTAFYFGTVAQQAHATDTQFGIVNGLSCQGSASQPSAADCLSINGGGSPNNGDTSSMLFENINITYYAGNGITCNLADDNTFINVNLYAGSGATGQAIAFNNGCVSNTFAGHVAMNGAQTPVWTAYTGSKGNRVYLDEASDSTPMPTISGGQVQVIDDRGYYFYSGAANYLLSQNAAGLEYARAHCQSAAAMCIYDESTDAIELRDGTNVCIVYMSTSNGIEIAPNTGTCNLNLNSQILNLANASSNYVQSKTTGTGAAFIFQNNASTPTTGDVADFVLGSTTVAKIANSGAISGNGHNQCSASSGTPCWFSVSCAVTASTTCGANPTVNVPSGSACTLTQNVGGGDNATGIEAWRVISLSTNTLTVGVTLGTSQSATAAAWGTCL